MCRVRFIRLTNDCPHKKQVDFNAGVGDIGMRSASNSWSRGATISSSRPCRKTTRDLPDNAVSPTSASHKTRLTLVAEKESFAYCVFLGLMAGICRSAVDNPAALRLSTAWKYSLLFFLHLLFEQVPDQLPNSRLGS